jgi:hypothetical protein
LLLELINYARVARVRVEFDFGNTRSPSFEKSFYELRKTSDNLFRSEASFSSYHFFEKPPSCSFKKHHFLLKRRSFLERLERARSARSL